ncbi:glutamic acid-rich protein [Cucumis melo var. makuwa]|uniref:Glutamic acid-rich protein n=1 Tax=Cucumis melo var. makuwa TaxID=1194695 RepID=A0A5D3CT23_CUCMM|nr:glutamic acid-rich protein [Cucumis melo var. makuwa]
MQRLDNAKRLGRKGPTAHGSETEGAQLGRMARLTARVEEARLKTGDKRGAAKLGRKGSANGSCGRGLAHGSDRRARLMAHGSGSASGEGSAHSSENGAAHGSRRKGSSDGSVCRGLAHGSGRRARLTAHGSGSRDRLTAHGSGSRARLTAHGSGSRARLIAHGSDSRARLMAYGSGGSGSATISRGAARLGLYGLGSQLGRTARLTAWLTARSLWLAASLGRKGLGSRLKALAEGAQLTARLAGAQLMAWTEGARLTAHGAPPTLSTISNEFEAAIDNQYRFEDADKKDSSVSEKKKRPDSKDRTTDKTSLRVKFDDEQIGKTTMENGGNGNLEDVSGKRKGGGLKIEIEDKPSGKVEMDVESSDVVALLGSLLRFENNVAKGKSRKKLEDKKSLDLVDLSTKKKNNKKKREEDDDFQKNNGEAMVNEEVPVLDSKELKRKEKKKSKNRELGKEGHVDGSEKQHSTKRRKV